MLKKTHIPSLSSVELEAVKARLEPFAKSEAKVSLDLRNAYHDYASLGQLLAWLFADTGVRSIEIHTDVPLRDDDSILDMLCRGLPIENRDPPTTRRESIHVYLQGMNAKLAIFAYDELGSVSKALVLGDDE